MGVNREPRIKESIKIAVGGPQQKEKKVKDLKAWEKKDEKASSRFHVDGGSDIF